MKEIKDFCKWLGVNEKVAKVVVWLFLIMISLIIVNASLDSLGFPYYKITADNLSHINTNMLMDVLSNLMVTVLNFYSIIFLVFSIKKIKRTYLYLLLYLFFDFIINTFFGYIPSQVFILFYMLLFCYLFSNKNLKYIIYGIISLIINISVQYICYVFKMSFIDFSGISGIERILLSLDYFIIMLIIILIKEIIINKKRGEKKCLVEEHQVCYGLENSTKKNRSQKKSQPN